MIIRAVVAVLTFTLLDAIWLGVIAKSMYIKAFGDLMRIKEGAIVPLWPAAIVVYIALILGILVFVIPKSGGQIRSALLWGAIFGFVTYATYDFTNLAVLSHWSLKVSVIDTLWGMLLCALTSGFTVWITPK